MISNMLPRLLRALSARISRQEEDEVDLDPRGSEDVSGIIPETFNMTLLAPVRLEVALRALKRACYRHGARLSMIDFRKAELNVPSRAIVLVRLAGGKSFKALLLTDGDFASFISLP